MLASRGAENSVIKIERTQLSDGSTPEAETRSTSPSVVELRGRPGRRKLDWVCGKTEMTEDSADCAREHDGGHETQAPLMLTERTSNDARLRRTPKVSRT
jgi:hypothetical protein